MNNPLDSVPFDINQLRSNGAFNWDTVEGIDGVVNNINQTETRVLGSLVNQIAPIQQRVNTVGANLSNAMEQSIAVPTGNLALVDQNILANLEARTANLQSSYGTPNQEEAYYIVFRETQCGFPEPFVERLAVQPRNRQSYGRYDNGCILGQAGYKIIGMLRVNNQATTNSQQIDTRLREEYDKLRIEYLRSGSLPDPNKVCGLPINTIGDAVKRPDCPTETQESTNQGSDLLSSNQSLTNPVSDNQSSLDATPVELPAVSPIIGEGIVPSIPTLSQNIGEHIVSTQSPYTPSGISSSSIGSASNNLNQYASSPVATESDLQRIGIPSSPIEVSTGKVSSPVSCPSPVAPSASIADCCNGVIAAINNLTSTIERLGGLQQRFASTARPSGYSGDLEFTISLDGKQKLQDWLDREEIPENPEFDVPSVGQLIQKFVALTTEQQKHSLEEGNQ